VTTYYDSEVGEIVGMWQKGATGPLRLMTLERARAGKFEREVLQTIDNNICFLHETHPPSENGQMLVDVRSVLTDIWDRCYLEGFVGRPRGTHNDHDACIPGSIILMYHSVRQEAVAVWEEALVGPIRTATFKRVAPSEFEHEIANVIGFQYKTR
jgi:hypothetical protein